jgi:hypothetical protein
VYIQTNTLNVSHKGAPLLGSWVFEDHRRLLSKGALLYCVAHWAALNHDQRWRSTDTTFLSADGENISTGDRPV